MILITTQWIGNNFTKNLFLHLSYIYSKIYNKYITNVLLIFSPHKIIVITLLFAFLYLYKDSFWCFYLIVASKLPLFFEHTRCLATFSTLILSVFLQQEIFNHLDLAYLVFPLLMFNLF